jgi:hypothetical protein
LSSSVRGLDAMRRSSHGQPRGAIQPPSFEKATSSSSVIGLACFQRSNVMPLTCGTRDSRYTRARRTRERAPMPSGAAAC